MKTLVRSVFDPSPRTLSVKSLAVLVGMLTCGIGISVHEDLESARPGVHAPAGAPAVEPRACKQEPCRDSDAARSVPAIPSTSGSAAIPEPRREISSYQGSSARGSTTRGSTTEGSASTQWNPDGAPGATATDSETNPGSCSVDETGRVGSVSIW